ncbi:hypothetical protein F5Y10DRAFT_288735 [Nemania abortiva]|nr:hypothetical protein F5Y10DRAFT_288735 [Nemania abortiva]
MSEILSCEAKSSDNLFQASTPIKPDTPQEIFLIHGFQGARYSYYRDILEVWVSNLAKTAEAPVNAHVFRFDGSSLPAEGNNNLVDGAVQELRDFFRTFRLMKNLQQNEYEEMIDSKANIVTAQQIERSTKRPPLIGSTAIFIAHGVGCWVIKDVLASLKRDHIAPLYERAEIVFVDPKIENPYPEYLNQTWTLFNCGLPVPHSDVQLQDFSHYLQGIDEEFSRSIQISTDLENGNECLSSEGVSQKIYRGQDLNFWMPKKRTMDANKQESTGWVSRLFRKQERPPPTEIIYKLFTFQELVRHTNSQAMIDDLSRASKLPNESTTPMEDWVVLSATTLWGEDCISGGGRATPSNDTLTMSTARNIPTDCSQITAAPRSPATPPIVRIKTAVMEMYRGHYSNSRKRLCQIAKELNDQLISGCTDHWTAELLYRCQELLAKLRLLMGQWVEAVTEVQSLINDKPYRPNVRLHTDLALAYAHLGKYCEARKSLKLAQERAEAAEEGTILVATATLDMLAGNYPGALTSSSNALDFMKNTKGPKHFRTLVTATLHTWCLAYNGRYIDASRICETTRGTLNRMFGSHHPQTLDASDCDAYIDKCLGNRRGGIKWINDLNTEYAEWLKELGGNHPQAIRSKFLLAMDFLANGEYANSKGVMDSVVDQAKQVMGIKHPETLRYESEQARIILHLGNDSKARELAFLAATRQFELYFPNQGTNHDRWANPHEAKLSHFSDILRRSSTAPHPFLVSTLELIADIEVRKYLRPGHQDGRADVDTARAILTTIEESYSRMAAQDKVLINSIDLGLTKFQDLNIISPEEVPKAIQLFKKVYETRRSYLDDHHPDTLSALWVLKRAECELALPTSNPETFPIGEVISELHTVTNRLEFCPGPLHPETLRSKFFYLAMTLGLDYEERGEWRDQLQDLVESLSDPEVVDQRLVESLSMKGDIAHIFIGVGKPQEVRWLVNEAISQLDRAEAEGGDELLKEPLSYIRGGFLQLKRRIDDSREEVEASERLSGTASDEGVDGQVDIRS